METLLIEFVRYLRENGIKVAPSSLENVLTLLPHIKVKDRLDFEISLSQLFVLNQEQKEVYALCFQEFFYENIGDTIRKMEAKEAKRQLKQLEEDFDQLQKENEEKKKRKEKKKEEEKKAWADFLQSVSLDKESSKLKNLHEYVKKKETDSVNQKSKETLSAVQPKDITDYLEELIWEAIDQNATSVIYDSIDRIQKELKETRNLVLKYKKKEETLLNQAEKTAYSGMRLMMQTHIDQLKDREIARLNKQELEEIREYIRQHSRGLFTRFSKLFKNTQLEKELDFPRIIQNSARTYGVPIDLFYTNPKRNKTDIHVIMDVSGSVVKSAELLLMFIYLIHQHFPNQVRAFTFVGLLTEITEELKNGDWEEMLDWCLKRAPIDYRGYSDYDHAFGIYEEEAMDSLTKDTIVLIVGDARNNRNDARVNTFRMIQEKSKAVYWINPEPKSKWNTGDSVIWKYQMYANQVFEVINTKDLLSSLEEMTKELTNQV